MIDRETILARGRAVLSAEAAALAQLASNLDDTFVQAVEIIAACKGRVILIAIGKSGHVAEKVMAMLNSLGTPALFLHADEAVHGDMGMIQPGDVLMLISKSGETDEILHLLPYLDQFGCPSIAITASPKSTLARWAHLHLHIGDSTEADTRGLAPTTSTTLTMALGDALAIALADLRGFTREDFGRYHPGGSLGKQFRKPQG